LTRKTDEKYASFVSDPTIVKKRRSDTTESKTLNLISADDVSIGPAVAIWDYNLLEISAKDLSVFALS
jgi:hypothetical protein